ncbi:MAG: LCP family protein [Anaerolineaceae bacterium]|nr:LCP family protein [Anaerolineaceae bacterium]MDD4042936.1 LCP family protein [Anaerolineaceae bacterium]MDD4577350.1 LCP family protein [Anaerolineaceae bacterium]
MKRSKVKAAPPNLFVILITFGLILTIAACNFPQQVLVPLATDDALLLTPTPVNPDAEIFPENAGDAPVEFTPAALLAPEETPLPATGSSDEEVGHCGRNDTINLLLLGIDKHAQADGIRLIRVDFKNATVKMTSIPRDFYVPIVGFEQFGIDYGRINATFGYGEYFFGTGSGADSIAENVTYNFGVDFDDQFVLYYTEIGKYIDAIGGITVTTEKRAQDYWYNFPPGTYEMDGETAVVFMRIRAFDTDIQRINRQTLVMEAILDKVRGGISPKMVYEILTTLMKDKTTQTNLGLTDMYSFYCLSKIIKISDIQVSPIPDTMFHPFTTETGAQVLIPHEEVVEFVQQSLGLLD